MLYHHERIKAKDVDDLWSKPKRTHADMKAQIEEMAEMEEVCELMLGKILNISYKQARIYISQMVKDKILQKYGKRYIDGSWQMMYGIYEAPPQQQSMIPSAPAVRDALVKALFGDDNRDSEAAWVF